jgi:hypothetical protein
VEIAGKVIREMSGSIMSPSFSCDGIYGRLARATQRAQSFQRFAGQQRRIGNAA